MNLQLLNEMMERSGGPLQGHWRILPYMSDINPHDTYGFVYCIENTVTNKLYLGRKQTKHGGKKSSKTYGKATNWAKYTGSSKDLNQDIEELGKDKFNFYILEYYYTRGGLNAAEPAFQHKCNALTELLPNGERKFYNGQIGAVRWITKESHSDETRARMVASHAKRPNKSQHLIGKPANNPNLRDNLVPGGIDDYAGWNAKRIQINKDDSEIIFNNSKDAAKFIGCAHDSVARVARGEKKTIYGWKAKFISKEDITNA
jgi:hypothetical protein